MTVKDQERVNVPVWAGVGAIAIGSVLLPLPARRRSENTEERQRRSSRNDGVRHGSLPLLAFGHGSKTLMAARALYVVAYAIVGYAALPLGALVTPQMRATYVAHRWESTAISSARSRGADGLFQFSTRLRNARPNVHLWKRLIHSASALLAGRCSVCTCRHLVAGGASARVGFAALALCWLYSGARVRILRFAAARSRSTGNGWCATSALTFGGRDAADLSAHLPPRFGIDFDIAYPVIAWIVVGAEPAAGGVGVQHREGKRAASRSSGNLSAFVR